MFSKQNYDRMTEVENKNKETKLEKKTRKIQDMFDKDFEEQQRKEEFESHY